MIYRYVGSRLWGLTYPQNSFLFWPFDRFMDFFNINYMVAGFNPYYHGSSYPPLALMIAYFFTGLIPGSAKLDAVDMRNNSVEGMVVLFSMYFISLLVIFGLIMKSIKKRNIVEGGNKKNRSDFCLKVAKVMQISLPILVVLGLVLAAPVIFAFDRGNYLILCVVFLTGFCLTYNKNDYAAAIFLALAAAVKLFPIVLFFVFIRSKKWKPLALGLGVGGSLTVICAALFEGGLVLNLQRFFYATFLYTGGFPPSHSYYYNFAIGTRNFFGTFWLILRDHATMSDKIATVSMIANLLLMVLVILLCIADKRSWRQIMYLSFFMILFPTPSFYYNLAYLIGPAMLFLLKEDWEFWDYFYLVGLTLLMIPKNYHYTLGVFSNTEAYVSINSFLDPLIMFTLLGLAGVELIHKKTQHKRLVPVTGD